MQAKQHLAYHSWKKISIPVKFTQQFQPGWLVVAGLVAFSVTRDGLVAPCFGYNSVAKHDVSLEMALSQMTGDDRIVWS